MNVRENEKGFIPGRGGKKHQSAPSRKGMGRRGETIGQGEKVMGNSDLGSKIHGPIFEDRR